MAQIIDLTAQTFGNWTVLRLADIVTKQGALWLCRCSCCGTEKTVQGGALRAGKSRGCGGRRSGRVRYNSVMVKLRKARGKASERACIDCGGPAEQWRYDGSDPDELYDIALIGYREGREVAYSTDPSHYDPLCRRCVGVRTYAVSGNKRPTR